MKSFKKLTLLTLVVMSLLLCTLLVASCGGNTNTDTSTDTGDTSKPDDTETDTSKPTGTETGDEVDEYITYTVYFQNQNGQPIEGVTRKFAQIAHASHHRCQMRRAFASSIMTLRITSKSKLTQFLRATP